MGGGRGRGGDGRRGGVGEVMGGGEGLKDVKWEEGYIASC